MMNIDIRPVSDLRNNFREIEEIVSKGKKPVFLTKNGYGSMVLISLEQYSALTDRFEIKLDEADRQAKSSDLRLEGKDVFKRARKRIVEE